MTVPLTKHLPSPRAPAQSSCVSQPTQGKGAALRAGFQKALDLNLHWAITLDGDGQHDPSEIRHFIQSAETTGALMVIGNRMSAAARIYNLFTVLFKG